MKSSALSLISCVAVGLCQVSISLAIAEEAKTFAFKDDPGKALDVLCDGKIVGRYMYAYDTSTPDKKNETYKPYLHVFDAEGKAPITKGPGGEYTHHRGILIGWMKIGFNGKSYDRWHMKGGEQVHQKFSAQKADAEQATFTSTVNWNDEAGKPIIEEARTMTFRRAPAPAYVMIDFSSTIKAPNGDVTLDGDPEHAGIQFRPANEVDRAKTVYTLPGEKVDAHKEKDLPWIGETFSLNGKTYSVVDFNHPGNPTGTKISAYRNYGRFGMFPTAKIKAGETVTFNYRFLVAEGQMPSTAVIQNTGNAFTGQSAATPAALTVKPAEQPAPPKAKEPKKDAKKPATK